MAVERGWVYVGVDQDARLHMYGSLHPGQDSYVLCVSLASVRVPALLLLIQGVLDLHVEDLQAIWVSATTVLLPPVLCWMAMKLVCALCCPSTVLFPRVCLPDPPPVCCGQASPPCTTFSSLQT